MKYSIIIPAYNAEKTIIRTLESLVFDTDIPYEVIVVNDGSTDNTQNIVEQFIKPYDFMKIIYKENGWLSSARNFGTKYAKGQFIIYADADDYFEKDSLIIIDRQNIDCDLLVFGFKHINKQRSAWSFDDDILSPNQFLEKIEYLRSSSTPWAKVYKKDIIQQNSLSFVDDDNVRYGEDVMFIYDYLLQCKRVKTISDILYLVDASNESGISRRPQPNLNYIMRLVIVRLLRLRLSNKANTFIFLNWLRLVLINEIRLKNYGDLKYLLKEMRNLLDVNKLEFSYSYSIYENILLFFYKAKMYSMVILIMKVRVKHLFK